MPSVTVTPTPGTIPNSKIWDTYDRFLTPILPDNDPAGVAAVWNTMNVFNKQIEKQYDQRNSSPTATYDSVTLTYLDENQIQHSIVTPKFVLINCSPDIVGAYSSFLNSLYDYVQNNPSAYGNSSVMAFLSNPEFTRNALFSSGNFIVKDDGTNFSADGGVTAVNWGNNGDGFNNESGLTHKDTETLFNLYNNNNQPVSTSNPSGQFFAVARIVHEFMHTVFSHNVDFVKLSLDEQVAIATGTQDYAANWFLQHDGVYGSLDPIFNAASGAFGPSITSQQIHALAYHDAHDRSQVLISDAHNFLQSYANTILQNFSTAVLLNNTYNISANQIDSLLAARVIVYHPPSGTPDNYANRHDIGNYISADPKHGLLSLDNARRLNLLNSEIVDAPSGDTLFDDVTNNISTLIGDIKYLFANYSSEVGQVLGSTLGGAIFKDRAAQLVSGTVLGVVGQDLGQTLENELHGQGNSSFSNAFKNFPTQIEDTGIGAISSFLLADLINSLGLPQPVGGLINSTAGAAIGQIAVNLAHLGTYVTDSAGHTVQVAWNTGINPTMLLNAAGAFIGSWLASELVHFDSAEGQLGASIGSAAAVLVAAQAGWIAGPVGYAVAAFVGYIVGGLIGSLFSPGTPRSSVAVYWDEGSQKFVDPRVLVDNRASPGASQSMGDTVAGVYNSILAATGSKLVRGEQVRAGTYGTDGKQFVYFGNLYGASKVQSSSLNDVVSQGLYAGVSDMVQRLVGGNFLVKRAVLGELNLAASAGSLDANTLSGDISVAQSYGNYLHNKDAIDAAIAAEPDTAFTAGWAVTFARALELGLNKRAATDWSGGWNVFLDQWADPTGLVDGNAAPPTNLLIHFTGASREFAFVDNNGNVSAPLGDTVQTADKDHITGTAGNDIISLVDGVNNDTVQNTAGLTINGAAPTASTFQVNVAAVIDAGDGDDIVYAGDLGNDVLGGAGNDVLVGGKLDDWLMGGDGNDTLFAAQVGNIAPVAGTGTTISTDEANTIAMDGGNGNYLDGGADDDTLYGGSGSDWLAGGDGNDRLLGGDGGDILDGGAGTDAEMGGEGTDQYLFGVGDGADVIFDDGDPALSSGDVLGDRLTALRNGTIQANWAGGGNYEVNGDVVGGQDAISFKAGVSISNLDFSRPAGTDDLVITLLDSSSNPTGDVLTIQDWFRTQNRVEWLRFADGDEFRIGDTMGVGRFAVGTSGDDAIIGTAGADFLWGGAGNDHVFAMAGNDVAGGGTGNDVVAGDEGADWVLGGAGNDQLFGGTGDDTVEGDAGDDFVDGGDGNDILTGGKGNDTIITGAGDDLVIYNRGDGQDTLIDEVATSGWQMVWDGTQANSGNPWVNGNVRLADGEVAAADGTVLFDGVNWKGQFYYDPSYGRLYRYVGDATTAVQNGGDKDTLQFGVGIDIQDLEITSDGAGNWVIGIAQDDNSVAAFSTLADKVTIANVAGGPTPIENYVFAATGSINVASYEVDAAAQTDGNDYINDAWRNKETWVTAMNGDDTVVTGSQADIISAGGGNDTVYAGDGADVIYGGSGTDTLDGGAGADQIFGGDGLDIASYDDAQGAVQVSLDGSIAATGDAAGDVFKSIEGLQGSKSNDLLVGDGGDNLLIGGQGDDTLKGGQGNDTYQYDSGDGNDTVDDAAGGSDLLVFGSGIKLSDLTFSRSGADVVIGVSKGGVNNGSVTIVGQTGSGAIETLQFADGLTTNLANLKIGAAEGYTSGDDLIVGGSGNDSLQGGDGNDVIYGGADADTLAGGDGNDILEGGAGADNFDGGTDDDTLGNAPNGIGQYGDTIRYAGSSAGVAVDLGANNGAGSFDSVINGAGSEAEGDSMAAYLGSNLLAHSEDLDDAAYTVVGGTAQADVALAPDGANTADRIMPTTAGGAYSSQSVVVTPNQAYTYSVYVKADAAGWAEIKAWSNDTGASAGRWVNLANGQVGAGSADANGWSTSNVAVAKAANGYWRISLSVTPTSDTLWVGVTPADGDGQASAVGNGVLVWGQQLEAGATATAYNPTAGAAGAYYASVENLTGSMFGDALTGDARNNRLSGLDGDDTIHGGGGDDVLSGGAGADQLDGQAGNDALTGDDGADTLWGGVGNDTVAGAAGDDVLWGDTDEAATGGGADVLTGGDGADTLYGGSGDDTLSGDAGNDVLWGDDGNDTLAGGDGKDTLYGGAGDDVLSGGAGNDYLSGDAGADTYQIDANSGIDAIVDGAGTNTVAVAGVENDKVWLTKSGDDLIISVIGGNTQTTIKNFYASSGATLMKSVQTAGHVLYLKYAQPLIDAMSSASTPSNMPQAIADMLATYWLVGNTAPPVVQDKSFTMNQGGTLNDLVGAVDWADDALTYAPVDDGQIHPGVLSVDAAGNFTYQLTDASFIGQDSFQIKVTDTVTNQSVTQTVSLNVLRNNVVPTDITISANTIAERDHPIAGSTSPMVAIGALQAVDTDGAATPLVGLDFTVSDPSTFSLVQTADGLMLELNANEALDYETKPVVGVDVTITDSDFNKALQSGQLDGSHWGLTSATVTADQGADADGVTQLDQVTAGTDNSLHGVTQDIAGAVNGKEYTLTLYARASGSSHYLLIGDTGDTNPNLASFDLSGNGAVRAQTGSVYNTSILNYGNGLYRVSMSFERASNADFQLVLGPDRASSTVVHDGGVGYDTWTGADESVVIGNVQLEEGHNATSYVASTGDLAGSINFTKTIDLSVTDQTDYFYGDNGDNELDGQPGANVMYGGVGNDTLNGGVSNDYLSGDAGGDILYGGLGDDTVLGGNGDDLLDGGGGNDSLDGGVGDDILYGGDGADTLLGGDGNDTLYGGRDADVLDGGTGINTVSYADSGTNGVTASLTNSTINTGFAAGDTYANIQNLTLSAGDDVGYGDNNDNVIDGGDGDDTLIGGGGADTLYGGDGADTIYGDGVLTSGTANTVQPTDGDDVIRGGGGNDIIYGGGGRDMIYGEDGNDTIYAGDGGDQMWGGGGDDLMVGGTGSDTYHVDYNSGHDTIIDFDSTSADQDIVGYSDNISRNYLWFERSGNDLVVSLVGSDTATTIQDWFSGVQQGNYHVGYIVAGTEYTEAFNATVMSIGMSAYVKPTTTAEYDALRANVSFQNMWNANSAPSVATISTQTINEDGGVTVNYSLSDDILNSAVVVAISVGQVAGATPATVSNLVQPDANGNGHFTLTGAQDWSGQANITLTATDPGGLWSTANFALNVTPVADTPLLQDMPNVVGTMDSGSMAMTIPASLADTDGSETLQVRIGNFQNAYNGGLRFNHGAWNAAGGYWSLSQSDLTGLLLTGPVTYSTNLTGSNALTVTAISTETANGSTATSAAKTLSININARPTSITFASSVYGDANSTSAYLPENQGLDGNYNVVIWPGVYGVNAKLVGTLQRTDPDVATDGSDPVTWTLTNSDSGAFQLDNNGNLYVANGNLLDYDNPATRNPVITVTATDSSGLSYSQNITINLTNTHDIRPTNPTGINYGTYTYWETTNGQTYGGSYIGTVVGSNPEPGWGVNYRIVNGDTGLFSIQNGNQLYLTSGSSFDFDYWATHLNPQYDMQLGDWFGQGATHLQIRERVTLQAIDTAGVPSGGTIDAYVYFWDQDEAPIITAGGYYQQELGWSQGYGTQVGWLNWYDPDYETANQVDISNPAWSFYLSGASTPGGLLFYAGSSQIGSGYPTYQYYQSYIDYNGAASPAAQWTDNYLHVRDKGGAETYNYFSALIDGAPLPGISTWYGQTGGYTQGYAMESDFGVSFAPVSGNGAGAYLTVDSLWGLSSDAGWGYPGGAGNYGGGFTWQTEQQYAYLSYPDYQYYSGDNWVDFYLQASAHDQGYRGATYTGVYHVSGGYVAQIGPVVFNLGGSEPALTHTVSFKASADASTLQYNWIAPNQAFLFLDRNGNGVVDDGSEISFVQDKPGATSDLEGMAAYDTNGDGVFDAQDARFGDFKIWQDLNSDGISTPDEIKTLAQAGITSVNLTGTPTTSPNGKSPIRAVTSFAWADGAKGMAVDYELQARTANVELIASYAGPGDGGSPPPAPTPSSTSPSGSNAAGMLVLNRQTGTVVRSLTVANGVPTLTGLGAGEGVLAMDWRQDGKIDDLRDINFNGGLASAVTPSVGLIPFDLNRDGLIDQADAAFKDFGVWHDLNGDGLGEAGEFASLADLGVKDINLHASFAGNVQIDWTDGSVSQASPLLLTPGGEAPAAIPLEGVNAPIPPGADGSSSSSPPSQDAAPAPADQLSSPPAGGTDTSSNSDPTASPPITAAPDPTSADPVQPQDTIPAPADQLSPPAGGTDTTSNADTTPGSNPATPPPVIAAPADPAAAAAPPQPAPALDPTGAPPASATDATSVASAPEPEPDTALSAFHPEILRPDPTVTLEPPVAPAPVSSAPSPASAPDTPPQTPAVEASAPEPRAVPPSPSAPAPVPEALSPANASAPADPAPSEATPPAKPAANEAAPPAPPSSKPTASATPPASSSGESEDQDPVGGLDLAAFASGRSAADEGLGLVLKMRLQMVNAMAGFSSDPGALFDDQGQRLKDPAAIALLTQLPDYRIVRPASASFS